eukprot:TRINITY_DN5048_c0_g1_i1.p1 TRINITY_DN5048_c0_g1~~TRINITY_DN5048_c0_g1_i1.p1  ORF type:complete len:279 (-),score=66.41 TRINITY_DN5048_c0_g1_i1:76-912(-)
MASTEEKVAICTGFIGSAPPGELDVVLSDIRNLLIDEEHILNDTLGSTLRDYNTDQFIQVEPPGKGHKFLITKYGELPSQKEYLDPRGGLVVTYDHGKQAVTGSRPIAGELDAKLEPLRAAFERAAIDYAEQHYPHGTTSVYSKDGEIVVAISAARFNSACYWNGRWRAAWTFAPGAGEVSAHIRVTVHYFEDGNVQLNTEHSQKVAVQEGAPDVTAKNAFVAITKAEQAYQQALDTSYQTMGDTTFKALRRALPITRTKIDWNKIRNYKVGGDLQQK